MTCRSTSAALRQGRGADGRHLAPSAQISLMSGNGVLAALRSRGVDAHAVRPARARSRRTQARRLRALLHRAARPPRRGRHRAGRARTARHSVHRLGRDGLGDRDRQGDDQARVAGRGPADAALAAPRHADAQSPAHLRTVPDDLGLPLIVKPPREGSSIGVTKVLGYSQMQDAVRAGRALRPRRAVRGVHRRHRGHLPGARRGRVGTRAAGRAHRRTRGQVRLPEQVLHRRACTTTCPSGLPAAEEAEIQRIVLAAYRALGCRGWGRADLMIRAADRKPFLLEMNTSPGMTGHSLVPMSAQGRGHLLRAVVPAAAGLGAARCAEHDSAAGRTRRAGGPRSVNAMARTATDSTAAVRRAPGARWRQRVADCCWRSRCWLVRRWWLARLPAFTLRGITRRGRSGAQHRR